MPPVYSYTWLCGKMADRSRVAIRTYINGSEIILRGLINGIRPEDGSGHHWLVTIHDNGTNAEVYIRTA
jgi:hypothetical protein